MLNNIIEGKKMMRKKIHALWMMFLLSITLLIGCSNVSEQENSQIHVQNQEVTIEHQTANDQLMDDETQRSENEQSSNTENQEIEDKLDDVVLDEDGSYTSKEEVAAYIHQYGRLPSNFITKKEAKKLGWVNTEGNLSEVAPGKSIGGDYFGNYEGMLPEKDGRDYYECDINTDGSYRGAERIVFSNDGLIYYTPDHYDSFELLYGDE